MATNSTSAHDGTSTPYARDLTLTCEQLSIRCPDMPRERHLHPFAVALIPLLLAGCATSSAAVSTTPSDAPTSPSTSSTAASNSPALQSLIDAARKESALNLVWGEGTLGSSSGIRQSYGDCFVGGDEECARFAVQRKNRLTGFAAAVG